jgi:hypothetical protein
LHWWHRSIGTPYHIAEVDRKGELGKTGKPIGFHKVFGIGQKLLNATARIGVEAEKLAPTLLPRIENIKDLATFNPHKKDLAAAHKALVDGTLAGLQRDRDAYAAALAALAAAERAHQANPSPATLAAVKAARKAKDDAEPSASPMAGVRWTDADLRARGMTQKAITLYKEALAATSASNDALTHAFLARLGKAVGIQIHEYTTLNEAIAAIRPPAEAEVAALEQEMADTIDSWKKKLAAPDKASQAELAKARKAIRDVRGRLNNAKKHLASINEAINTNAALKEHGYFPLMRFGDHTVVVKSASGETLHRSHHETKREAEKEARGLQEVMTPQFLAKNPDYQGATVEVGVVSKEYNQLFQGISPETVALFAKHMGVDASAALQEYLRTAVGSRSVLKRHIHRQGTAGYSGDIQRTLAQFLVSNARAAARALHMDDLNAAVDAIPRDPHGDVRDRAEQERTHIANAPPDPTSWLRSGAFAYYLGGNIASMLTNMTQPAFMSVPGLQVYSSYLRAAAHVMRAQAEVLSGMTPADVRADTARAVRDGIIYNHQIHDLSSDANGGLGHSLGMQKVLKAWGSLFSLAEAFNRKATFWAALRIGRTLSQGKLAKAGVDNAYDFAVHIVNDTQGIYNKGNRAPMAKNAVGAFVYQFKQFSVSYLEWFWRLPPQAKAMAFVHLLVLGGLMGAFFADDLKDVFDTLGQWAGYNTNSEEWLYKLLTSHFGEDAAETILHGVSHWLPFDVSGRLGMGNLIPGTAMLKKSADPDANIREVIGVLGASAGILMSLMEAVGRAAGGDIGGAIKAGAPTAVRNAYQGVEIAMTGEIRDKKGNLVTKATPWDGLLKGLGLAPRKAREESRLRAQENADNNLINSTKRAIVNSAARAILDQDAKGLAAALKKLTDWNEKNPEAHLDITPQQIANRAKEMSKDANTRLAEHTPKAQREQTMRDLGVAGSADTGKVKDIPSALKARRDALMASWTTARTLGDAGGKRQTEAQISAFNASGAVRHYPAASIDTGRMEDLAQRQASGAGAKERHAEHVARADAAVAEIAKARGKDPVAAVQHSRTVAARRTLIDQRVQAQMSGDSAGVAQADAEIAAFNGGDGGKASPRARITRHTVATGIRAHKARAAGKGRVPKARRVGGGHVKTVKGHTPRLAHAAHKAHGGHGGHVPRV